MSKKKKQQQKKNKQKQNKNKNKNKTKNKQQQQQNTQKTHRPYSSLDLTDPNFAFGRIFFTILLESLKNQPFLILSKIF